MDHKINNVNIYNQRMAKTALDKLFFLDKVNDVELFVDFGCADGIMAEYIGVFEPDHMYIGYDLMPEMVDLANDRFERGRGFATDDWGRIVENVESHKETGMRSCLILSSVIHEVYHYGTSADKDLFWKRVFESGFDYVAIRDMIPSRSIERRSDINDVRAVLSKPELRTKLHDHQRVWGSIDSHKSLTHFLMKYEYNENWLREAEENYFPLYREELMEIPSPGYEIIYYEHYALPYKIQKVQEDFGIRINDRTHLKALYKLS